MLKKYVNKEFFFRLKIGLITISLGDYVSQKIEMHYNKERTFNAKRFMIQSSWAFIVTPYFMVQFHLLEKFCKVVGLKTLFLNMIYLQFFSSPICYFIFFMHNNLLNGMGFNKGIEIFKERILEISLDNGKFWPFVNFINFYIIPYHLRVYFAQFSSLIWNIYLSYFLHTKKNEF